MKQFSSDIRYVEATPRKQRKKSGAYSVISAGVSSSADNSALKSYVDSNFMSLATGQDVSALHNFLNGFYIAGIPFRKMANGSLFIDASVVFGGGVTMYGTDTTPAPSIFDGLPIDGRTIKRDGNGALYVDETALSVSGGGGVADSVAWANVTGKPTWITNTKPIYNYSEIQGTPDLSLYALANAIPTNNKQLTNGAGYITASALNGYATETFVNTAVNGAKEWVEEQQYLTEITSGMIESVLGYQPYDGDTNRLGFLTSSALNGYATQSWVNTALAGYLPKSGGTVNGSITATGDLLANGMVRATAYLSTGFMQVSSNIDASVRTSIFGDAGSGWGKIKAFRSGSSAVGSLAGAYASGILFAMSDTHGFIQLPSSAGRTGEATIGGGNGDKILWSAKLLHSLNFSDYALPITGGTLKGNLLTTGGITMYSQRSLKNILSYDGLSLEQLSVIKPIKFTWKDGRDNRYHVGGVADDMATVVPEVVYSANDFLTMDYGNAGFYVAASLIKPVIDHEQRIKILEQENKALREEINQLRQSA